ncbi:MAG: NYN domain-containing protein [Thiomicrospira sp.]
MLKTRVYIDGYNLYYGVLRNSAYKWLDVYRLFAEGVLDGAKTELDNVSYYTAPILRKMCDDPESPQRQRTYLAALNKRYPHQVRIVQGKLIASRVKRRVIDGVACGELVEVLDFEEKKTDVSIAVDMLADAFSGSLEQFVLCTNDSDLAPALAKIKQLKPEVRIGLIAPVQGDVRRVSNDLKQYCDWHKTLSPFHLVQAQLPDKIPHTSIKKPAAWLLQG